MNKFKEKDGISLVTLGITVIILLIIAGVGVSSLSKENGVIDGAISVNEKSRIEQEKEFILQSATFAIGKSKKGIVEKERFIRELDSVAGQGNTEVTTIGSNLSIEFIKTKRIYEIDEDGKIIKTNFENSQPVIDDIFKDVMGAGDITIETKPTQDTSLYTVSSSGVIDGFTYEDYNDLDETQKEQMKNIVIGENVEATTIAQDAFKGLTFIESLYISNSDLSIDISAFDSTSIEDIVIQANRVESKSFYNLYNLKTVTLKVNTLGDSAFENGYGKTLMVRANIIGNRAFYNNYGLEEADVKANEIGDELFASCSNLKNAKIEANTIGNNTFVQNSKMQSADIKINNDKLKTNSFVNCSLTTVSLDVKGIETGAFNNCWNLTSIIINSTLEKQDVATDFITSPRGDLKITYNGTQYTFSEFLQVLE